MELIKINFKNYKQLRQVEIKINLYFMAKSHMYTNTGISI